MSTADFKPSPASAPMVEKYYLTPGLPKVPKGKPWPPSDSAINQDAPAKASCGLSPYAREDSAGTSLAIADEDSPWARINILSFDGGGIRGLSSLFILRALMEHIADIERNSEPRADSSISSPLIEAYHSEGEFLPCHYCDYIGGTSTGGLIAIMLSRLRMSVDDCIREYIRLGEEVFGQPRRWQVHKLIPRMRRQSRNSFKPGNFRLQPILSSPDENNDAFESDIIRCKTLVCSVQAGPNKLFSVPRFFRSYPYNESKNTPFRDEDPDSSKLQISYVIQATIAAPSFAKSAKMSASLNNPTYEMFKEVGKMHQQFPNPVNIILSLGCGTNTANPSESRHHRKRLSSSSFEKHTDKVSDAIHRMMLQETHHLNYHRFDSKDSLSPIHRDEWSNKSMVCGIEKATKAYLEDPQVQIRMLHCARLLVAHRRKRAETMRWERFALGTRYRCTFDSPKPCASMAAHGKPFFENRVDLMDHLRLVHGMSSPDADNFEKIKSLLDRGRTDVDSSTST